METLYFIPNYKDTKLSLQASQFATLIVRNGKITKNRTGKAGKKITQEDVIGLIEDFEGVILYEIARPPKNKKI